MYRYFFLHIYISNIASNSVLFISFQYEIRDIRFVLFNRIFCTSFFLSFHSFTLLNIYICLVLFLSNSSKKNSPINKEIVEYNSV